MHDTMPRPVSGQNLNNLYHVPGLDPNELRGDMMGSHIDTYPYGITLENVPDLGGVKNLKAVVQAEGGFIKMYADTDPAGDVDTSAIYLTGADYDAADPNQKGGQVFKLVPGQEYALSPSFFDAIKKGEPADPSGYSVGIQLGEDGKVYMRDLNGGGDISVYKKLQTSQELWDAQKATGVAKTAGQAAIASVGFEQPAAVVPDRFEHALQMDTAELWRQPDNDGKPIDQAYVEGHRMTQRNIVEAIRDGSLYKSPEAFEQFLKDQHALLAARGDYNRLNDKNLSEEYFGAYDPESNIRSNTRLNEAKFVKQIAEYYGDAYGHGNRFESGKPNSTNTAQNYLEGISSGNLAKDIVRYDEQGNVLPTDNDDPDNSGYEFVYPKTSASAEYMKQAYKAGHNVALTIDVNYHDTETALAYVAQQYQYLVTLRPFRNINNSLFMDLANAQLKLLGFNGVSHGYMDLVAQRVAPENFVKYFSDRVKGKVG